MAIRLVQNLKCGGVILQICLLSVGKGRLVRQIYIDTSTSTLTFYIVSSSDGKASMLHKFWPKQDDVIKFEQSELSLPVRESAMETLSRCANADPTQQQLPVLVQWSCDGSHIAAASRNRLQILPSCAIQEKVEESSFSIQNLTFPPSREQVCGALSFSPSTCCVCAILVEGEQNANVQTASVLLWNIKCQISSPDTSLMSDSTGSELLPPAAKIAAYRLAWCCVHDHCGWDVLQNLEEMMNVKTEELADTKDTHEGEVLLSKILGQVDELVHNFPHTPRPNYHMRWDRLKLQVANHLLKSQDGQV